MILGIIDKKRNKLELTLEEIKYAVDEFIKGNVKDYQMSSLLMAITINGMTDEEAINLTKVMIESGETLDLSKIKGLVVDKHSTGGVGDKTTLVLIPLLASLGLNVAKMSGRGLGHTGGTIDKFEAIGNFKTEMPLEQFIKEINDIHVALVGQMENIALADKKIYALRDVTGTVSSIPLIASSIMSKKIACASDIIVIDVKVGNGALMKNIEDARTLSKLMIKIGAAYNKKIVCVLTNMNEPLGFAVGNSLEVLESIDTLKGNGPKDLKELVVVLASILVSLVKDITEEEAKKLVLENLSNNKAYEKFEQLVEYQGGNIEDIKVSENVISIKSNKTGFITNIDTMKIGNIARILGAGRLTKDDVINSEVGLVLSKKVGEYVLENEEIIKVYVGDKDIPASEILDCFEIKEASAKEIPLIEEIIWQ